MPHPEFTLVDHNGRPHWLHTSGRLLPVIGGAQDDAPPPAGDPPAGDPPAGDPPAGDPPSDPPAGDPPAGDPPPADSVDQLPEWAQKQIRDLRRENGDQRTKAKTAEQQRDAVLAALGLTPDGDEQIDPVKLKADRDAALSELRTLRIENALTGAAVKHNADLDLVVPYLTGKGSLADLDPTSDTFTSDVEALVAQAVKANPKLAQAPAAGQSGSEIPGGSGQEHIFTREEIAAMSADDFRKNQAEILRQQGAGLIK